MYICILKALRSPVAVYNCSVYNCPQLTDHRNPIVLGNQLTSSAIFSKMYSR